MLESITRSVFQVCLFVFSALFLLLAILWFFYQTATGRSLLSLVPMRFWLFLVNLFGPASAEQAANVEFFILMSLSAAISLFLVSVIFCALRRKKTKIERSEHSAPETE